MRHFNQKQTEDKNYCSPCPCGVSLVLVWAVTVFNLVNDLMMFLSQENTLGSKVIGQSSGKRYSLTIRNTKSC